MSTDYIVHSQRVFDERIKLQFYKEQGIDRFYSMITRTGPCDICANDDNRLHILPCEHVACRNCWKNYITAEISNGRREIVCIDNASCQRRLNDKEILSLITVDDDVEGAEYDSTRLFNLRQLNIRKDYLSKMTKCFECLQDSCDNIIEVINDNVKNIECDCGAAFCMSCKPSYHFPLTCEQAKTWGSETKKVEDDLTWIEMNTKRCPRCKTPSDKISGCDFVICYNPLCKIYYCWICLRILRTSHEPHSPCIPVQKSSNTATLQSNAGYRTNTEKREIEEKLLVHAEDLVQRMKKVPYDINEINIVKRAVPSLLNCRSLASNCYAFTFYISNRPADEKLLLTHIQKLENELQQFSTYLSSKLVNCRIEEVRTLTDELNRRTTTLIQLKREVINTCSNLLK